MIRALAKQSGKSHFLGRLLQLHLLGHIQSLFNLKLSPFGEEEKTHLWAPHYFIFKLLTWMIWVVPGIFFWPNLKPYILVLFAIPITGPALSSLKDVCFKKFFNFFSARIITLNSPMPFFEGFFQSVFLCFRGEREVTGCRKDLVDMWKWLWEETSESIKEECWPVSPACQQLVLPLGEHSECCSVWDFICSIPQEFFLTIIPIFTDEATDAQVHTIIVQNTLEQNPDYHLPVSGLSWWQYPSLY